ncbi:MAG: electron transporter RnfD [Oscillospiraceae bacterium]|nr:electron transporter RnfD [Oscillospiraceae bacterium]
MIRQKFISADSRKINYMGRIDFSYAKSPMLIYAGSCLTFRFTGSHLSVIVSSFSFDSDIRIGYLIDGKEETILIEKERLTEFTDNSGLCDISFNRRLASAEFEIPVSDDRTIHEFTLFKRMGGAHLMTFEGLFIDENSSLTDQPPLPPRKIEFYGDSVCCGSVCEALDYIGRDDPPNNGEYNNSWHSFSMITARLLNAQIHNIAQGGMALLNGTGYCFPPEYPGLERIFSSLQYMSYYPESRWDFRSYIPHVVVFAVGQNDPHREDFPDNDINDPEFRNKWKSVYLRILSDLLEKYPDATFILSTTILMHNPEWDCAIDEIVSEINSHRVLRFRFRRNGTATPGHPRIPEQEEMACELTQFINSLGPGIWNS